MKDSTSTKDALIEEINMLGPWVHGYFELECGVTIKDTDIYQRARLFHLRDLFVDIIKNHFGSNNLRDKSICDVGCNTGYFLFELFKYFNFKSAEGFDPRKSNIDKAKFIAKQFALSNERYSVTVGNLYNLRDKDSYDIVIMPGVLHHLDDHILACKRLYDMTDDLLILETMALPEEVESESMAKYLELKDDVYKKSPPIFGVTGLKLESEYLDGATATSGIVAIPSKHAIYLSLFNAGFRDIKLFDVHVPSDTLEIIKPKYRDFCVVLAVAAKPKEPHLQFFEDKTRVAQNDEIDVHVPRDIIEPLYLVVEEQMLAGSLTGEARATWFNLVLQEIDRTAPDETLKSRPYYGILCSLTHQPVDKIRLEYAKTLFRVGENSKSGNILREIIHTPNCDWRSVYKSYHMLSLIALNEDRITDARMFNSKALRTYPNFFPALSLLATLN